MNLGRRYATAPLAIALLGPAVGAQDRFHETVVVTGTGTEYLATEAPVRTELITTEMVDQQVKTTLSEALTATVPGVRIEMNCQNCGYTELRMNGLEGAYTQILEDGLPNFSGVE